MDAKILVIEDEEAINDVICMSLRATGYEVSSFPDGDEASAWLEERHDYDCAVVDVMLPGKDGFALLPELVKHDIPVIFLTARGELQDRVRGLTGGAEDYMVKPFGLSHCKGNAHADRGTARGNGVGDRHDSGRPVCRRPLELPVKALNLSRTSVYNVRILLSAPGFFPVNNVFIGNMEAGTEGTGTMSVYIGNRTMEAAGSGTSTDSQEKYGKTDGTITLQYQDADGRTYTLQQEFRTEIKKPRLMPSETKAPEEGSPWWISASAVMIAALAALSLLLLSRLRRKNVLLEEARKMVEEKQTGH